MTLPIYIIAEIGPNHNGSLDNAKNIISKLARSGANAVKFQLANPHSVYSADAFKADYQKLNDGPSSVIEMSQRLQLSQEDHIVLKSYCDNLGLTYLCTAFDLDSLIFLDQELQVPLFKIASGEILSIDMLEYISEQTKPVVLSTGMSSFEDINSSLSILTQHGLSDITLLHCVSSYPALPEQLNLRVISDLLSRYNLKVGFSDHSLGNQASLLATALGVSLIEKHVTLDKLLPGPDHKASLDVEEFYEFVRLIRLSEQMLGAAHKVFAADELKTRDMARKSIVLKTALTAGSVVEANNITFKRPGTGISPLLRDSIVGRKVLNDIPADRIFLETDLL